LLSPTPRSSARPSRVRIPWSIWERLMVSLSRLKPKVRRMTYSSTFNSAPLSSGSSSSKTSSGTIV
jgi:hypothetical protein